MRWQPFFESGSFVSALPGWSDPKLFVAAGTARRRWTASAFYPAYRRGARAVKSALRIYAGAGVMPSRRVDTVGWPLADFVDGHLCDLAYAAVLVGTEGPTQKLTAQLRDRTGRIVGYVKYADSPAALNRLRREHGLLKSLPEGVGPRPLKLEPFMDGMALLVTPVHGETPRPYLPVDVDLNSFLERLATSETFDVREHPAMRDLLDRVIVPVDELLEALGRREWPATIQHGDLAPWNVRRVDDGTLRAIDWEHGCKTGFPHFDTAYYLLQVAALMHRWSPQKACTHAVDHLAERSDLDRDEARAIVALSALDACCRFGEDGVDAEDPMQKWRRAIYEEHL